MTYLASLIRPNSQVLNKFQVGVFSFFGFHNFRTSNDTDIKLKPLSKRDNDVMLAIYNVMFTFLIFIRFGVIRKPTCTKMMHDLKFSLIFIFHLTKSEK